MSSVTAPEPEEALNVAVSAEPGTDAPDAPPLVADQLVVLFQFPSPPVTQNRAAMIILPQRVGL
jgi:hypothetical protein